MQTIHSTKVQLLGGDQVSKFVQIASSCSFPVFLCSGRYRINGKSLIGIFSLDLSKPIRLEAQCTDAEAEALYEKLSAFLVDGASRRKEETQEPQKSGGLFGSLFGRK